jgi:hypothetical protein
MIIYEKKNGITKIYSDKGKKIRQIETNRIYSVAIEKDYKYTYEEVDN